MTKININNTKFLDAKEINHKDIVVFENQGAWEESTRFKKEDGTPTNQFKINIKLGNEEIRQITLNWSNIKLLVKAFGDETADWVGRQVRAWKTKSERAKAGFIYIYAPIDWVRNDMGEWENEKGESIEKKEEEKEVVIEYPEDEPNEPPF